MFQDIDACDDHEKIVRENYVRAFFKYPGSKARSVEELANYIPYRNSYIEVFGGSAALLLSRKKSLLEVYNDRFAGVVAFFRCLKDQAKAEALVSKFEWCLHSREEFIFNKETWTQVTDNVERAARWLYIQHYSFAGIGKYFGRSTTSAQTVTDLAEKLRTEWKPLHQRIKNVTIENQDWREMLKDFDSKSAVFYLDPPYLNSAHQAYADSQMFVRDHRVMLEMIFKMQGFVAVSSYDNELYDSYPWDEKIVLKGKSGNCMAPGGKNENKILQGEMQRGAEAGVQEILFIKK